MFVPHQTLYTLGLFIVLFTYEQGYSHSTHVQKWGYKGTMYDIFNEGENNNQKWNSQTEYQWKS